MRDFRSLLVRHLPDGLTGLGFNDSAIEFELDLGHSAASLNSSGKYLITEVSGLAAAWPRPQIDASRIAWLNSSSNWLFQTGRSINSAAFSVPTRQGVHWPQLSSSKKRIRFSAAPLTLSCCERITIAAEPMKQSYFSSVPK